MICDHRAPNRKPATLHQKINIFWLASDEERNPQWPQITGLNWLLALPGPRWLLWFLRNPFCNLASVVIGICHRDRTVCYARGSGWTFVDGLNYGYSRADGSKIKLPFVSYRGLFGFRVPFSPWRFRGFEVKLGWETNGALSTGTLRMANAENAGKTKD